MVKNSFFLHAFVQFTLSISAVFGQKVEWVSTTLNSQWQKERNIVVDLKKQAEADIVITMNKAQYIDGIGGTFNELGWDALITLPIEKRKEVLLSLFGKEGANFNYNRIPIGASDYGLNFYSLNDVDNDFKMVNFNINRDRYILIPYIKAAQEIMPNMKIWASPWSPPAWMKTTNHYACDADDTYNGMSRDKSVVQPATAFKMQRGYLEAYALYMSKFVQAYEKEKIPISVINVQNEPCSSHMFPGCNWRAEDLTYFIGKYLGPQFEKDKLKTELYFGTINSDDLHYPRTALSDKDASKYIKGVGFQWEGKRAIGPIHKEYPTIKLMQTESECGGHANDWNAAVYTWSLIHQYLSNGANVYTYWNMVLDETGKSTWGWAQNSLISINKTTNEVVYHPEYFIMKHLSHFVEPGAYRLETSGGDDHLAFLNPDGKIIIVLVNNEKNPEKRILQIGDQTISATLKAESFNTLQIKLK